MSKYFINSVAVLLGIFLNLPLAHSEEKTEENKISMTKSEFEKKINDEVILRLGEVKKKSIVDLTKEVLQQKELLKIKEEELKAKESQLAIYENELAQKSTSFDERQKKVLGCITENQKNQDVRITTLVEMISQMKPEKAASILSVQESDISVQILSKIEPAKASKIFNLMDKEISARLQKEYLLMKQ